MQNKIEQRCKYIAAYNVAFISLSWEMLMGENKKDLLGESLNGLKIIGESIGIEVDLDDYSSTYQKYDWDKPISSMVDLFLSNDQLVDRIKEVYGNSMVFIYSIAKYTAMLHHISDFLSHMSGVIDDIPTERQQLVLEEKEKGIGFLHFYVHVIKENKVAIKNDFPHIYDALEDLQINEDSEINFLEYRNITEHLVSLLAPNYHQVKYRLERAIELANELNKCKPGKNDWRNYEKVMNKILRFLFIPPFKKVIEQASSESGDIRRDAVLPNNQSDGFWKLIREEFNSRHIICEFKNYDVDVTKDNLNQLRIYLSRKTVGRFGLLFIRKEPNEQLLGARRCAYGEDNIMILILTDEDVIKMLKLRAFLLEPEEVLEDQKIKFELSY